MTVRRWGASRRCGERDCRGAALRDVAHAAPSGRLPWAHRRYYRLADCLVATAEGGSSDGTIVSEGRPWPTATDRVRLLVVPLMSADTSLLIQWLAISYRPGLSWDEASTRRYFLVRPQTSFFRRLGVPGDYSIIPYALTPRDGFHVLTTRSMPEVSSSIESRRLPYRVKVSRFDADITSVVSRLYPMGIQVVRVSARVNLGTDQINDQILTSLQALRKPHSVRAADHVIRQVFALATGDRTFNSATLQRII